MRWLTGLLVVVVVVLVGYYLLGPEEQQDVAEQTDQAVDEIAGAADQAVESVAELTEDAAEATQNAVEDAVDATQTMAENAADSVQGVAEDAAQATADATDQVAALVANGVDFGQELTDSLGGLTNLLSGLSVDSTAEAVQPELDSLAAKFDDIGTGVQGLSDDGKAAFGKMVVAALPQIESMIEQAIANETLGPSMEPILTKILESLRAWSQTTG